MDRRRFELQSTLTEYEKRKMRDCGIYFDRSSRLYAAGYGQDIYAAVRNAMFALRRTFNVRYTHVDDAGRECPCFSAQHANS